MNVRSECVYIQEYNLSTPYDMSTKVMQEMVNDVN